MSRRIRWPDEIVRRARKLHDLGYGESAISKELWREKKGDAPSMNVVRDWIRFRSRLEVV